MHKGALTCMHLMDPYYSIIFFSQKTEVSVNHCQGFLKKRVQTKTDTEVSIRKKMLV
jgi:hypothetical protein